ncbi:MAG: V-type ATPase subunit [candidate division WOR-3 bacterium]
MNRFEALRVLNLKYTYALGLIRAKEVKLISKKRFEELVSSKDVNELIAALHDTDYASYLRVGSGYEEIEEGLQKARIELYREVEKLVDDPEIMKILRAKFDFHNITVLLKGRIADKDFSDKCSPLGSIPIVELEEIFKEEKYRELPFYLREAIDHGVEAYYSSNHNPQRLSFAIDSVMAITLTSSKNEFLNNYYKLWIDLVNLKTILRLLFVKRYQELVSFALLCCGNISKEEIEKLKIENSDSLLSLYKGTIYEFLLEWKDSFPILEREGEKLLISYLRSIAFESIGVEPIISYLLLRENEIKNLRIIFIGKANGVEEELIKERLII